MQIESAFQNLIRGNRVANYWSLVPDEGVPTRHGPDYLYLEVGVRLPSEPVIKKGQTALLLPACTMQVSKFPTLVKVNPALVEVAQTPLLLMLDPGDKTPQIPAYFRKDYDLTQLGWLVRLYMMQ